tara:strand:- start:666 stop:1166 length:501 start_codon:yes stop_codon:yes gene_type:complete
MNKRGDIPTILLFIVALILAVYALFAFASFEDEVVFKSKEASNAVEKLNFNENYVFINAQFFGEESVKNCINCDEEKLKERLKLEITEINDNYRYEGAGNFFLKVRQKEFKFKDRVLQINGLFVKGEEGDNKLINIFDLKIEFDSDGKVLSSEIRRGKARVELDGE